jgi:hypothetical protein
MATFWSIFIWATLQHGLKRHEIQILLQLVLPQARHTFVRPSPPLPDSPAVQLGSTCNISFNTPNRRPVYTSHQRGQSGNSCPSPLPHAEQLASANFREGNKREFGLIHIDWSSLLLSPFRVDHAINYTSDLYRTRLHLPHATSSYLYKQHTLELDIFKKAVQTASTEREGRDEMRCLFVWGMQSEDLWDVFIHNHLEDWENEGITLRYI